MRNDELSRSMLRSRDIGPAQDRNDRNISRRLSVGHSEAGSTISAMSQKHRLLIAPLQDRTHLEVKVWKCFCGVMINILETKF